VLEESPPVTNTGDPLLIPTEAGILEWKHPAHNGPSPILCAMAAVLAELPIVEDNPELIPEVNPPDDNDDPPLTVAPMPLTIPLVTICPEPSEDDIDPIFAWPPTDGLPRITEVLPAPMLEDEPPLTIVLPPTVNPAELTTPEVSPDTELPEEMLLPKELDNPELKLPEAGMPESKQPAHNGPVPELCTNEATLIDPPLTLELIGNLDTADPEVDEIPEDKDGPPLLVAPMPLPMPPLLTICPEPPKDDIDPIFADPPTDGLPRITEVLPAPVFVPLDPDVNLEVDELPKDDPAEILDPEEELVPTDDPKCSPDEKHPAHNCPVPLKTVEDTPDTNLELDELPGDKDATPLCTLTPEVTLELSNPDEI